MPNKLDPSSLLNPMTWTDAGLRAIEMAVSSAQNISEEVDRLARAGADAELVDEADPSAGAARPASSGSSWAVMTADLQRSSFEVLTQGWLQSASAINNFLSLGTRLPSTQGLSWQILPWEAMRRSMLPIGWAGIPAMPMNSGLLEHDADGGRRQAERANGQAEHAHAAAEPKRHRSTTRTSRPARSGRTKSKSRRSRST